MNHRITDRHSKNNRATNEVSISSMSNSFAILMIYHGVAGSAAKPETNGGASQSYRIRK